MKYFFLRFVPPEKEKEVLDMGFRPFKDADGNEIWFRDNRLAPTNNPLEHVPEDQRLRYFMKNIRPGQVFVADMWGQEVD